MLSYPLINGHIYALQHQVSGYIGIGGNAGRVQASPGSTLLLANIKRSRLITLW